MRAARREFSVAAQVAIVARATDVDGKIKCELCGAWCKSRKDYEIDHIISEGIRPAADKKRKLTPADGQLLCVAVCHPRKTKEDKGDIGKAKRLEAAALGVKPPPRRKINWGRGRERKPPLEVAAGKPRIAREYGQ